MEFYFKDTFTTYGRYDFPLIRKQEVALAGLKLIRFSSIVKDEHRDLDASVHFFEDDERFDEVWKNPEAYTGEIAQYRQVLSPNFSVYVNMPRVLQIFNTFRSRWLGAYWQEAGLTVIPTLTWADKSSYEFCFDAIESGSVVAVSTLGCADVEWLFLKGFAEMCARIEPELVICHNEPFARMHELARIIEVPYSRTKRTSAALLGDEVR
ncbi:MAG: DUF4417 domain-containing protein [Coriobacteriales bacterium]|jgi:hypothetical protein|nr:DUF4417 domain-containing protein [Coriobacteriales bacterium]